MRASTYRWSLTTTCGLLIGLWAGLFLAPPSGQADYARVPEPDPPAVDLGGVGIPATAAVERRTAAATEWTHHKTSDNLHPDGNEQQFLWLMNRARSDPAQEGIWLATMDDPDVAAARSYFGVDVSVLFIVGTVWEDTNSNDQYDPGEGLADVTVMPDKGAFFAVTGNSGGYAIPITAADDYRLSFSGGDLTGVFTRTVTVGSASVLQDLEYFAASAANPADNDGGSSAGEGAADGGGSGGGGGGGGCMIGAAVEDDSDTMKHRAALSIATLMAGLGFLFLALKK